MNAPELPSNFNTARLVVETAVLLTYRLPSGPNARSTGAVRPPSPGATKIAPVWPVEGNGAPGEVPEGPWDRKTALEALSTTYRLPSEPKATAKTLLNPPE